MRTTYRHRQVGVLPIILWITLTAFCVAMGAVSHLVMLWVTAAILAVVGLGMSYLTTTVTDDEVRATFGPGLFRRRIPLADIVSAEPAQSSAGEGWGIRITFDGMLYNITGNQTVRIHLRSGTKLRIGTDDPTGFAAAINASASPARSS